jgi:hypothetical protein
MKLTKPNLLLISASLLLSSILTAQQADDSRSRLRQLETPDDKYIPVDTRTMERSPAYTRSSPAFYMTQVNVDADGMNIVGDAANEPSITFDRTNPDRMAIGWRQFDNVGSNFRQAGLGITTDGGQTWTFDGVLDPGTFRSDPVLDSDGEGNFYYNSLTVQGDYWCEVFESYDGGANWTDEVFAYGGDKQWFSVDKAGGIGSGHIYNYWSTASICEPYYFTRSTDGNMTWEDCIAITGGPYWGTTAVNADGDLFLCGQAGWNFLVVKSSTAKDPGQAVTWDFATPVDLDGRLLGFGGFSCPNPGGLLGQTIIAIDSSGGPTHDNIYLLASVERESIDDPLDVMFSRSTDGGQTWSDPVRVNDDLSTSAWQWFGTMSVAPNGRIDVAWLDTRDDPGGINSALYYSYSTDAGETWSQNVRLSDSFDPHLGWPNQEKMGDYFDMFSDETSAHLAWASTLNGEQDVYYGRITPQSIGIEDFTLQASLQSISYPNPFREQTTIRYFVPEKDKVSLKVFSISGAEIATLIDEYQGMGVHQVKFDASRLDDGVYYYRLQAGDLIETGRLVVIRD